MAVRVTADHRGLGKLGAITPVCMLELSLRRVVGQVREIMQWTAKLETSAWQTRVHRPRPTGARDTYRVLATQHLPIQKPAQRAARCSMRV
jgi:hypothetical protein